MKKPRVNLLIRDVREDDFTHIQRIYAPYVQNSTVSLEEIPPSVAEMKDRWIKSMPYIVAAVDEEIVGYAYAFPYRTRTGYRFTVEESVYVAEKFKGNGIGFALLSELIRQCSEKKYKQMVGVISGVDNAASIKLHETLGFKQVGILHKVGFKFGQWIDTVFMQRQL